jgi:hypothetical protein
VNGERRTANSERRTVERRTPGAALLLIEEAIQLLRIAPVTVYALYCAGTIPFLLAFFSFCAEMSYNRYAADNCAGSAVAMALTYCWMKGLQAFCCRELVRVYTGNVNRWWSPGTMLAIWSRQIAIQPFGFFVKPLAWLLVFPVTFVSGFFQNLSVLGGADRNDVRKSWKLARLWPKQSYGVYSLLSLLALIVFFDLYALVFSIPLLLKILLGIESFLTRSYTWAFSPILLITLAAVSYFLVDLLAKAIEVIRCCDGEALATGVDLLRRLAALEDSKQNVPALGANRGRFANSLGRSKSRAIYLLFFAILMAMPLANARGSIDPNVFQNETHDQRLTKSALDQQIERVLQNPEYSWRAPSAAANHSKQKSILEQWRASILRMLVSLGSWVNRLLKPLFKPFDLRSPFAPSDASHFAGWLNTLGYLLWAAFAGGLILLSIRILKLRSTNLPASIVPAPKPDLADEGIKPDQLPDNEWYALAREKLAAGELRQAQRALFLAILSYLAAHRFITIERSKSNTDYEKELGRKAKHPSELPVLFAQSRLGFERCWYGADSVTLQDFDNYNDVYEKIKHAAT